MRKINKYLLIISIFITACASPTRPYHAYDGEKLPENRLANLKVDYSTGTLVPHIDGDYTALMALGYGQYPRNIYVKPGTRKLNVRVIQGNRFADFFIEANFKEGKTYLITSRTSSSGEFSEITIYDIEENKALEFKRLDYVDDKIKNVRIGSDGLTYHDFSEGHANGKLIIHLEPRGPLGGEKYHKIIIDGKNELFIPTNAKTAFVLSEGKHNITFESIVQKNSYEISIIKDEVVKLFFKGTASPWGTPDFKIIE